MLRLSFASLLLTATPALAEPSAAPGEPTIEQRLIGLQAEEAPLNAVRASIIECEGACLTPSEAVELAFAAGDGAPQPGRFLLDIRGGGQSLSGNLGQLFFINSKADYAEFGTLTIAFEADVLNALLRRARSCGGGLVNGKIAVEGCRQDGLDNANMFSMAARLFDRRIVVDGKVQLQWIDWRFGARNAQRNTRGERERGYYQPWVWVYDADQISFVYDD
ncbi:MAG: hypothetical protein AAGH57_06660 [Pseudomonadota bacterium]